MNIQHITTVSDKIVNNINRVIVGKRHSLQLLVTGLLADAHILIDDVPGTGKTTMARAFSRSIGASFSRIQFTPDLLPSDVTGLYYFNQQISSFKFRPGPIMNNIVLADEINRATPRTQSSLLEAMQERQVTVDGCTHTLERPFMVLATQNPVEMEGTFPLPEAQLDRFGLSINLGYPQPEEEDLILTRFQSDDPFVKLQPVVTTDEVISAQAAVQSVHVSRDTRGYLLSIVQATRERPEILLGASPRASLILFRCAQALAAIQGRDYVTPEIIQELAIPTLAHRIILRSRVQLRGHSAAELLTTILSSIPVPVERERGRR